MADLIQRARELCQQLQPVLGDRVNRLWTTYIAESQAANRADIERTLELLAAKHLGVNFSPDRNPFPPPSSSFCGKGEIPVGDIYYGGKSLRSFKLRADRLKEHLLICGRSGSGKTNLAFHLMEGIMNAGIKVLAMDWKRGYRDLLQIQPDLRVYTVGRDVSPIQFNPLIPPAGCEPRNWGKLIIDVIASAYFGGEGVISILNTGLNRLYEDAGVFGGDVDRWPTPMDLLVWLKTKKLTGRAAMWKASAERIMQALSLGEFGKIVDTQNNADVAGLLLENVVLEMDGLASNSDRIMFSEALTLYIYRLRLSEGPRDTLTNLIILEEAHNLLLAGGAGKRESILENSIRMIRQYGLGYVFIDQSASLLSKVAFANSYATIALSQKLRGDIQAMSSAMNLSDSQKESLSTLPIGSAVVRLADEHPEPFLVRVPRTSVIEGQIQDHDILRARPDFADSMANRDPSNDPGPIPDIPVNHRRKNILDIIGESMIPAHPPPTPLDDSSVEETHPANPPQREQNDTQATISREAIRFLVDIATRPLSTTVSRYQKLHLSRRKGNAIRQDLIQAGIAEAVAIATRSGQVMLCQLTDRGRRICVQHGIDPPTGSPESLEHRYWKERIANQFRKEGYRITLEYHVPGDGFVDVLANRDDESIAIEVETGRSNIRANVEKLRGAGFSKVILFATTPAAVEACHAASHEDNVDILTWLDLC